MSFADNYFRRYRAAKPAIQSLPHPDLALTVVIPCYDESSLHLTINDLFEADQTESAVEIIVLINAPPDAPQAAIRQNQQTIASLKKFQQSHSSPKRQLFVLTPQAVHKQDRGVGWARKIGMDEALYRYNILNRPEAMLISLDADTRCPKNYLKTIEDQCFHKTPNCQTALVAFEHPLAGSDFPEEVYLAIIQYELYLRYYIAAMRWAGFPFAYQTIGSCFAVRANAYALQGGMNKRQGGEDFYFLHKLFPMGGVVEITNCILSPSPRLSKRVPFGTGPALRKLLAGSNRMETYKLQAFNDLYFFLSSRRQLFKAKQPAVSQFIEDLPAAIITFLQSNDFHAAIADINRNSTKVSTFDKRFWQWFTAFRLLKYLNAVHPEYYESCLVEHSAKALLKQAGQNIDTLKSTKDLLLHYRQLDHRQGGMFWRS